VRVALNLEQLLQPVPGGTGRYVARLAGLLPALFPGDEVVPFVARHRTGDVAVALGRFGLDAPSVEPPVVLPLPRPLLYDAWHVLGALAPARYSRSLAACDVLHAPSPAVPPSGGRPLVVTLHDAAFELFPEAYTRHGRRFHRQGAAAAARRARAVITATRAAAAEIAAHTPISPEQLRVVPDGVDQVGLAEPEVASVLAALRLDDAPYVLWVGTLEPRKNVGTLVQALAELARSRAVPHRLVLVSPGGWRDQGLIAEADRSVLGERLRALRRVPEAQLRALYAGADLFCLPSLHEGFGLTVLEAMVQGTAVVCSDLPALREVAGEAAQFVGAHDAHAWATTVGELLGDPGRRARLGAAGAARAKLFTWERCVQGTRAVYAEVVGGGGQPY
jgi:glycosyltransferase involved in cell wall biosynthesis